MAYVAPTYAEFVARFPIFGDKDQSYIEAMIVEANRSVDQSWTDGDYKTAIMYLAAHLIATDNMEAGSSVVFGPGSGAVASESFGGMSISYEKTPGADDSAAKSQWGSTEYGRRFYRLLKLNKSSITVV
jgi:hypothetical protein